MLIRMINAAFGPNGTPLYAAGQQYDLPNSFALELIGRGSAVQVNNSADALQGTGTAGSKPPGVPGDGKQALRAILLNAVQTGVMASPPTVTMGANNANSTVLTDQDVYTLQTLPTSAAISPISGKIKQGSSNNYLGSYITETFAEAVNGWGFGFSTDGEAIDLCYRDVANAAFMFRVREPGGNWQWVSTTQTAVGASGANFKFLKLDFGSSKARDIEVYCHASNQIRGIVVGPSAGTTRALNKYRIWATAAYAIKAMVIGDSYTAGSGASQIRDGFAYVMGDTLGIPNIVASGVGGQGYIANSNNGAQPFISRVADVSTFGALDWVDIALGINDYAKPAGELTAAVTTALQAIKEAQPAALVTVSGPWTAPGKIAPATVENAIKAGFDAVADPARWAWIPTVADNWQDTSGGNSTLYMSGDNTHPNTAGHGYLGRRRAAACRAALLALTA